MLAGGTSKRRTKERIKENYCHDDDSTPWGGDFKRGGGGHKASISDCLPLAAPIGLSPLLILTLCGPECVLVRSTEPLDDLSCLTPPGSAVPERGGGTYLGMVL